jgi:hypothetical protein
MVNVTKPTEETTCFDMERGPFAGFYPLSELPSQTGEPKRWASRHSDGELGEVLLGDKALIEAAKTFPQGGPWGTLLWGEDTQGAWIVLPGELFCSLAQLQSRLSAPAAFLVGHLILEALEPVHSAQNTHGHIAPENIGFDAKGILRVRARPGSAAVMDLSPDAEIQATDCWAVGGVIHFLLGGEWPPVAGAVLPDFEGMDSMRAKLALSGLLRTNPRLRLTPAQFARQAVGAALQGFDTAEADLRTVLQELGLGVSLRDSEPVLPLGLDADSNRQKIKALSKAEDPLPVENPKKPVPVQKKDSLIHIALGASPVETEDLSEEVDSLPEILDEEDKEAEQAEQAPPLEVAEEPEEVAEEPEEVAEEPEEVAEEPEEVAEEPEEVAEEPEEVAEEPEEANADQNSFRIQMPVDPNLLDSPVEQLEPDDRPLESEPFRMPLPEALPLQDDTLLEDPTHPVISLEIPTPAVELKIESPVEAPFISLEMPSEIVQESPEEVLQEEESSLAPVRVSLEIPSSSIEEPPVVSPVEKPSVTPPPSVEHVRMDWPLEVEVGTRSDLEEDLGPGKWVESGRSAEELVRELDSLPKVERSFELNPSGAGFSRTFGLLVILVVVLVAFSFKNSDGGLEEKAVNPALERSKVTFGELRQDSVIDSPAMATITTDLEHARVSLDGIDFGRAPRAVPLPQDKEIHKLCVKLGNRGRCVDLTAEELAAREPYLLTVE